MSKRLKVPYTVLLVIAGLLLVPLVNLPYIGSTIGFLDDLQLTPELLFYIFLPVLIFESAFNINVRKIIDSAWIITLLSIFGVIISSVLIASALYFLLPFVGIDIPFVIALLFGSIISATDPVAVLSLFKEVGAPKRLTMIFEGESLFNDGTAVALFLVILGIATSGYQGSSTVVEGIGTFCGMVFFGIVLGLVMAIFFTKILQQTKSNEFVTVTLLVISAHIVFILGELINENGFIGLDIHVSSIIATTVAALFLGNYSRSILTPKTDLYLSKFIEHMAFIANSLVFILAGILFATSNVDFEKLWLPILITVFSVAIIRAIAVYAVVIPVNKFNIGESIPTSWTRLLAWGSLRGALAIIVVLLIPADLTVAGWSYSFTPQEFLLSLTIGCILATLFIKAPLIGPIMRRLHIDRPEPLELAHEADLGIYYLLTEKSRFENQKTRGFVRDEHYKHLTSKIEEKLDEAKKNRKKLAKENGNIIFEQSLHMLAINTEIGALRQLYINDEINEDVYRKLKGKLNIQKEKIEYAKHDSINPSQYIDDKDIFDRMVNAVVSFISRRSISHASQVEQQLQYYRAQLIMARKCVKTIKTMQTNYSEHVFLDSVYNKVIVVYENYKTESAKSVDKLLSNHDEELSNYLAHLAQKSLSASGLHALEFLQDKNIVDEINAETIAHKWSTSFKD